MARSLGSGSGEPRRYHAPSDRSNDSVSEPLSADNPVRGGPVVGRAEVLAHRPDLEEVWAPADALFPVRVTRSFWSRIDRSNPVDPLALQVLPDGRELDDLTGLTDPVGDASHSPVPWVVHKYTDRALLLLTKRCHLYCRYCFRREFSPTDAEDPTQAELDQAVDYLVGAGLEEVILSGGDPLAVRDERLLDTIDRLRLTVPRIRIHSRAPITKPSRVTPELVQALAARRPVWMVVHCNHANELTAEVDEALSRLIDAGIPVLNQSVLLRGVNDDPAVLATLGRALVRRGVKPYYLHHTDPVRGASHLTVDIDRGLSIYRALRTQVDGLALPRYVLDPPDGNGKMDVEAWVAGQRR